MTMTDWAPAQPDNGSLLPFCFGSVSKVPFETTTTAFAHHALSQPSLVAVCDLSAGVPRQLTYGELAAQAQALAWHLRSIGVKPNQRVPLVVKRSCEMIIGLWAILLCGAQYVPLDGGVVPDSTLRHVFAESGGSVLVCNSSTEKRVQSLFPGAELVTVENYARADAVAAPGRAWLDLATPTSGCYVIYTSGE